MHGDSRMPHSVTPPHTHTKCNGMLGEVLSRLHQLVRYPRAFKLYLETNQ